MPNKNDYIYILLITMYLINFQILFKYIKYFLYALVAGVCAESMQKRKDSTFYVNGRSISTSRSSRSILPSSSSMSSSSMSISSSSESTLQRIFKTTPWSIVDSTQTFELADGSSRMMPEENSEKTQTTIRNYLPNESNSFSSLKNRLEYPVTEPSENFDVSRRSTKGTSKISRNVPAFSTVDDVSTLFCFYYLH